MAVLAVYAKGVGLFFKGVKESRLLPTKVTRWWPTAKTLLIVFAILAGIGSALVYLAKSQKPKTFNPYDAVYMSPTRDYQLVPFDMLDARHYCQSQTEAKYGDQLALSYVDEHSTRHDSEKGLYKIFLVAHVGDLSNYQETAIHCFVDQYRYKLTHYRTIKLRDTPLMKKALKLFKF